MFGDGPPKSAVSCQLVAAAGLNLVVPPKVSLPRLFLQSDAQLRLRKLAGVCYLLLGEQSTSSTSLTKLRSGWTYYKVVTPSSLSLLADPVANPIPKKNCLHWLTTTAGSRDFVGCGVRRVLPLTSTTGGFS